MKEKREARGGTEGVRERARVGERTKRKPRRPYTLYSLSCSNTGNDSDAAIAFLESDELGFRHELTSVPYVLARHLSSLLLLLFLLQCCLTIHCDHLGFSPKIKIKIS